MTGDARLRRPNTGRHQGCAARCTTKVHANTLPQNDGDGVYPTNARVLTERITCWTRTATYKYVPKLCRTMQNRSTCVQHSSQKLCQGRFPHALLPVPGEKNANFPISRLFPRDHPCSLDLNVGSPRNAMAYAKFAFFSPRQHLPQTEGNIEIGVDGVSGGRPMQDARVCVFSPGTDSSITHLGSF